MTTSSRRSLESGREWLLDRLERRRYPFDAVDVEAANRVIETLSGLEPEPWTEAWGGAADAFEVDARRAEEQGLPAEARAAWWQAYTFSFMGRYPCPNHPLKLECYRFARERFLNAVAYDDPPTEHVRLGLQGLNGDGRGLSFYVRRPRTETRPPVVVLWGGIDGWKEEAYVRAEPFVAAGAAAVLVDMPGVGEAPILAGRDAERQWTPILDWITRHPNLDSGRIGILGFSFGGYWATKLAHTQHRLLSGAVNWGGGVHFTFQPEWQARSRDASSYLMDLMETRARLFGGETYEDYVTRAPELSLLDQGLLDLPCAPLLVVNGKHDLQNSLDDLYLLLEHGDVKSARVFEGGHMGDGPVLETVAEWLLDRLGLQAEL